MNLDFLRMPAVAPGPGGPPAGDASWGRFESTLACRVDDGGQTHTLLEPLVYVDPRSLRWRVEAGSRVVGASLPRAFWPVLGGPYEEPFRTASVLHMAACAERMRPWRAIHRMFYEACRCCGVDASKAKAMYYAVFHFGPRWHMEERSSLESGLRQVEVVIRDLTPAAPTEAEVATIVRYFSSHDVAAEDIPALDILDSGD